MGNEQSHKSPGVTDLERLAQLVGLVPPEVLNEICTFLTIEQKKCMRLVCKKWRNVIDSRLDIIFNVTLTNKTAKWMNENTNTKYIKIGSLKVEEFTTEIEFTIFDPISAISTICFGQGNSKQNFEQIVALCLEKNVQKLTFGYNSIPSDVDKDSRWILPSVHSLEIQIGQGKENNADIAFADTDKFEKEEGGSEMLDFLKTLFIFPSLEKVSIQIVTDIHKLRSTINIDEVDENSEPEEKIDENSNQEEEIDENSEREEKINENSEQEETVDDEDVGEGEPRPSTSNSGQIKKRACYKCSSCSSPFHNRATLQRHLKSTHNCLKRKAKAVTKPKRCGKEQEKPGQPLNVKTRAQDEEEIVIADEKEKESIVAYHRMKKLDYTKSVVTKLIFSRTFAFLNEQEEIKSLSLTIKSDLARLMKTSQANEIVPIHCPSLEEIEIKMTNDNYDFVIPHLPGSSKLKKFRIHPTLSPTFGGNSERLSNQLIANNSSTLVSIALQMGEDQLNNIQLQNCSSLKELELFLNIADSYHYHPNQNQPEFSNFPNTLHRLKISVTGKGFEFEEIQKILRSIKEGVEEFEFNPRTMYFGMRKLKWILSLPKIKKVILVDTVGASAAFLAGFCEKQIPGSKSTFISNDCGGGVEDNGNFCITITEWQKKLYLN